MNAATREVYWNIEGEHWLYLLFIIALVIFSYGVYNRVILWKLGQPENRWKDVGSGIKDVITYGIFHKRILKDPYPGLMHFGLFIGFVFLAFATAIITPVSYTHLRAHETRHDLVCRLLLEQK